jgi:hypothetical protein
MFIRDLTINRPNGASVMERTARAALRATNTRDFIIRSISEAEYVRLEFTLQPCAFRPGFIEADRSRVSSTGQITC